MLISKLNYRQLPLLLCLVCISYGCQLFEKEFILPLPTAKKASEINAGGFTAHWSKVTGASDYAIDVSQDENFSSFEVRYHNKSVEGTSITINKLEANTTYYYRVHAHISNQISKSSNVIKVVTSVLNAPMLYEATDIQSQSFKVSWSKMPLTLTYALEIAIDSGFTDVVKHLNDIKDTSIVVSSLLIDQKYFYRVTAQQSQSFSDYSNIRSATTNALPAPVTLAADNQRAFYFTAHWQKGDGPDVSVFLLDVSPDPEFKTFMPGYENKEVAGTQLEVSTLDFRQTYYYRVRAKRLNKLSPYSPVMEVKPAISNSCKLSEIKFVVGGNNQSFDQRFTYDAQHRLETISYHKLKNTFYKVSYNTDNTIKNVVYISNNQSIYTYTYTYNADKLLESILVTTTTSEPPNFWTFTYNDQKQRTSWALYASNEKKNMYQRFHYTHDARGNVTKVKDHKGEVLRKYSYGDKLSPYALFGQQDLCFFIAHFRDQWTNPGQAFNPLTFAWRGFLPVNNTKNVITKYWSDESFQQEHNSIDVVTKQNFYFTVDYTFAGCSF